MDVQLTEKFTDPEKRLALLTTNNRHSNILFMQNTQFTYCTSANLFRQQ